jgi:predicted GIY-YIG superfamily endonuclease
MIQMVEHFFVYILKCKDSSYYVGHTDNLEKRLFEHNNMTYLGYTASRLPVDLVFKQMFESREAAFMAERKIKKWTRLKKEALIKGDFQSLQRCSKKQF